MQLTWCSQLNGSRSTQHTSYSTRRVAPGSGSRLNPGKKFFLQTAAECVRRVNAECDKTGANGLKRRWYSAGWTLALMACGRWSS
ncbi:hypothetical protein GQ600_26765 [Phytophthora cactorum]|nr:hypothetical protein GQ600_26765 [Phytophthora cactorum]